MTAPKTVLHGRAAETAAIEELLVPARGGSSGALVLRGEPGIGKTALLDHAAGRAAELGLRLLRGTGIEMEAELPFAGLQLLLRPALRHLDALPAAQRATLEAALCLGPRAGGRDADPSVGLAGASPNGPAVDTMGVGLAVLALLAEHAGDDGMLGIVDDAQWLDRASRDALLFAARRLHADGVALLLATRDGVGALPATVLPERRVEALTPEASDALLDALLAASADPERPFPPALRRRLLAEARGNPLALRELPVALAAERPGAAAAPGALPLTDRLQLAFHSQVSRLPEATQALLLVAAADETGELSVVLRAAAGLGAHGDDLAPAEEAGLVTTGPAAAAADGDPEAPAIAFRHPLIRAAVQQRAPLGRRLAVHRALADALDAPEYADRRAWHLASAATGADADAADALERTAERAQERSGHEAAAAAYERAARLTADPRTRGLRETLAAEAALAAGDLDRARTLASRAVPRVGTEAAPGARLAHVRALADFWQGGYPAAHRLLLEGAALAGPAAPAQAAAMLVQALHPAWYLGEEQVAETLRRLAEIELPEDDPVRPLASYFRGLMDRGRTAPPPVLEKALAAMEERGRAPEPVLMMACGAALSRGQDGDAHAVAVHLAAEYRAAGAAGRLPTVLFFVAEAEIFTGRPRDALVTATEARDLAADLEQRQWFGQLSSVLAHVAASEGDEQACREHAERGLEGSAPGSIAPGAPWAHWALGLLDLGMGRAESALDRLERLTREPMRHHLCATRSVPDLVEAAVRVGAPERAEEPFRRLERWAEAARRPWADALVLRCRALLDGDGNGDGDGDGDGSAEERFTAALAVHDREARPVEYARTALLLGEWLRRARRKAEARVHLAAAQEVFERLGMRPWAERARAELTASGAAEGASAAPARTGPAAALTPQELQIVRLAAAGHSNRDIAAQLFLSHRTVGYHLYKAYPKLGIRARGELKDLEL
ncbi:helix-turn-helix transcriptional regulator [Mangrovactinospora gilvigrisea]|uniref:Helix-turn-helix transcriptional regulator n=1 Tax=Mangrovactinospora gilvigrisea TaxID=1428644 RepID=A0A1J7C0N9_9ACTN|nr:helix-turn-helix transcriptional regulator [Mangrovactinospora gilvigrisea]OIV39273.1 helix-turn-helix transcriptional regulator [Mangrovactinospora gilvigrisea]